MNRLGSKTLAAITTAIDAWLWFDNILFVLVILLFVGYAVFKAWGK